MKVNITKLYEPPVCSVADIIKAHEIVLRKHEAYMRCLKEVEEAYNIYWWKCRSNNWLKMHGYPMRRRH